MVNRTLTHRRSVRCTGLQWQTRIRDPVERNAHLEAVGVRKPYDPESAGRWPKRAIYKTVRARIHVPSLKIAQEIPVWATVAAYSSGFPVEYVPMVTAVTRSKEEEWLDRQYEAFCARKVGPGGY